MRATVTVQAQTREHSARGYFLYCVMNINPPILQHQRCLADVMFVTISALCTVSWPEDSWQMCKDFPFKSMI